MPYSEHDYETFNGNWEPPPDNPNFPGVGRPRTRLRPTDMPGPTSITQFPRPTNGRPTPLRDLFQNWRNSRAPSDEAGTIGPRFPVFERIMAPRLEFFRNTERPPITNRVLSFIFPRLFR